MSAEVMVYKTVSENIADEMSKNKNAFETGNKDLTDAITAIDGIPNKFMEKIRTHIKDAIESFTKNNSLLTTVNGTIQAETKTISDQLRTVSDKIETAKLNFIEPNQSKIKLVLMLCITPTLAILLVYEFSFFYTLTVLQNV